jgi:hypothetical protein
METSLFFAAFQQYAASGQPAAQRPRFARKYVPRRRVLDSADRRRAEGHTARYSQHVIRLDVTFCVLSASSAPHRQRHRMHDLHSIFRRGASSANARDILRVGPKIKHANAFIGLKTLAIAYGNHGQQKIEYAGAL